MGHIVNFVTPNVKYAQVQLQLAVLSAQVQVLPKLFYNWGQLPVV